MLKKLSPLLFLCHLFCMQKKNNDYECQIIPRSPIDTCDVLPSSRNCYESKFFSDMNLKIGLNLLYFQAKERGLSYAISNAAGERNVSGEIIEFDFTGELATKVNIGFDLPYDYWDLDLSWTNFSTNRKNFISEGIIAGITTPYQGMGLLPLWIHPSAFRGFLRDIRFSNAKASWEMSFNSLDLEMGRDSCLSRTIATRFFFGLKNAYIKQRYFVQYVGGKQVSSPSPNVLTPLSADIRNRNDTTGIGPRIGIYTKWNFARNFGLFTKTAASLMATFFDTGRDEIDVGVDSAIGLFEDHIRLKEGTWALRSVGEFALGLDWGTCLCLTHGKNIYLNLSAAYEGLYYFKQNRMRRFVDNINQGQNFDPHGDLFLHGLDAHISFSF